MLKSIINPETSGKNLIPQFILEQFEQRNYSGNFQALAMFIDISGFTEMTDKLMKNGKEGAEILIDVINNVFTPSIDAIHNNGGFISTFGGDAFNAIFPRDSSLTSLNTAFEINLIFQNVGLQKTRFGDFHLSVKIGISFGNIDWGIVGNNNQNAYFFKGEAIDNCSKCEKQCTNDQIIFDQKLMDQIPIEEIEFTNKSDDFFILKNVMSKTSPDSAEIFNSESINLERSFIPGSVLDLKVKGEFRDVISCFVSFKETGSWQNNVSEIIDLVHQLGGYFNRISFGDKGGFLLVFFGAPRSTEKLFERSVDFASAVSDIPDFSTRIGLTFGTVFAGFTGSAKRQEYTCHGNRVNLAARFMMRSNFGEIYIDEFIYHKINTKYNIEILGDSKFKGFSLPVPVYLLKSKQKDVTQTLHITKLVGREKELQNLRTMVQPIFNKEFGGIVYVDGIAGIGKSRLVNELHKELDDSVNWFYLPCDEILQKSFNPVMYFLGEYFGQSEKNNEKTNKRIFEDKLDNLIDRTNDKVITSELIRTKSILGSLINLSWKNSLFEQLDAKGKYENTLDSIKNLIKAESLQKPVIIELEDGHWIDPDTKKLLNILTRNVDEIPFMIISACRYNYDGSEYNFGIKNVSEKRIKLEHLSKEGSKVLIQAKLDGNIPEKTFDLINNKSEGNPFYIEQIILYLQENQMLDNEFNIRSEKFKIPSSINEIIITRIDRLTSELKEVVKTASVLGREFAVNVLSKMLQEMPISKYLDEGEKETIWDSISEIKYLFHHALIREAVYEMQLKQQLRKLHKLAAETMEDIYRDNLESHYYELADHFEKAENFDKIIEYLEKAGNFAKENYQNELAINIYSRLTSVIKAKLENLDLSSSQSSLLRTKLIDALLNKGTILQLIGKLDDALLDYKTSQTIANKMEAKKYLAKIIGNIGHINQLKGNFDKAMECSEQALKLCEELGDRFGISIAFNKIGNVYFKKQNYDKAMEYYKRDLELSEEINHKTGIMIATGNIGSIYGQRGKHTEGMKYFEKQLEIADELNNKRQISYTVGNMGIVYYGTGNLDKAEECFEKQFQASTELGDKRGLSIVCGRLGPICYQRKDYKKALEYFERAIKISLEIGINGFLPFLFAGKVTTFCSMKKFSEAKISNEECIRIARKINDDFHAFQGLIQRAKLDFRSINKNESELSDVQLNKLVQDCIEPLENVLGDTEDQEQLAWANYELAIMNAKISRNENAEKQKQTSIAIYKELLEKIPDEEYKNKIDELEKL